MKFYFTRIILCVLFVVLTCSVCFAQIDWIKYSGNPVMVKGETGSWDDKNLTFPCVILVDGTYHIWYDGNWDNQGNTNNGIGHATSLDGINWEKDSMNPVLTKGPEDWDSNCITQASVLFVDSDSLFHMWYAGWGNGPGHIGHATSPDGTHWTKDINNPVLSSGPSEDWDDTDPLGPCVVLIDTIYHMWYNNWTPRGSFQIGHATSSDGIDWLKDSHNPVLSPGTSSGWDYDEVRNPKILYDGLKFHMWFTGGNWFRYDVGYAQSKDGSSWVKYDDYTTTSSQYSTSDPVLTRGLAGSWDDRVVGSGSVILNESGDSLIMWYWGAEQQIVSGIGYATAPRNINVPDDYETIQAAIDAAQDGNVVLVDEGTYYENINFKGKAITVASQFYMDGDTSHKSKTIIDGSQPSNPDSGSVVTFESGEDTTSILMGFTITGGTGTKFYLATQEFIHRGKSGGGINCWYSGCRISNNNIVYNTLSSDEGYVFGGGFAGGHLGSNAYVILDNNEIQFNETSSTQDGAFGGGVGLTCNGRIIDNDISNNLCTSTIFESNGGGVKITAESTSLPRTVTLQGNRITHNFAEGKKITGHHSSKGGGIVNHYCKVIILENDISYNRLGSVENGEAYGAGINFNSPRSGSIISGNTISNNTIDEGITGGGGGIRIYNLRMQIINNIISGNSAFNGGGIYLINSYSKVINNTIVGNTASTSGGGLYSTSSSPVVLNTIFWDNEAASGSQISGSGDVLYSDIQGGWSGEGNIDEDPLFIDTLSYDLSELSRCVGSGIDSIQVGDDWYYSPATDKSGRSRPDDVDSFVDMGAQESEFPNGIGNEDSDFLLTSFSLKQNYPNPFNPTTIINYELPITNDVELSIYNLLGQKVVTLVSEKQKAGHHQVEWDASGFASGIYYYKIKAGNFVETRKMVYLK